MKTSITLKQVLKAEAEATYTITRKLFQRVADDELPWKPASGKNWMTLGQLLMHCASFGCGKAVKGFVKGDWGLPADVKMDDLDAEQHVPPAETLASVDNVTQALELLAQDRLLTLHCIDDASESTLLTKKLTAPWGGPDLWLFQHLLLMIAHLNQHKGQLFYYLKLMGKDLDTSDLWGT